MQTGLGTPASGQPGLQRPTLPFSSLRLQSASVVQLRVQILSVCPTPEHVVALSCLPHHWQTNPLAHGSSFGHVEPA